MRIKKRGEGLTESDFIIGSRFMVKFVDENGLRPFNRKSELNDMTFEILI